MSQVPAYCTNPRCGAVFEPGVVFIDGIADRMKVEYRGGLVCPQCGSPANLVTGTFNATPDRLELVSGPPISRAIIEHLYGIAQKAKAGEITPQQAVADAAKIDPRLGNLVERYLALGISAVALLVALLAYFLGQDQYKLQQEDSVASSQFYARALSLLERQVEALEDKQNPKDIETKSSAPAAKEADEEPPAVKGPSKRRAEVNKERRKALKERRRMFSRRRS